ncbi:MAG: hypothetical protein ACE5KZ_05395 [Candidatus Scalinduaceae bacterium]
MVRPLRYFFSCVFFCLALALCLFILPSIYHSIVHNIEFLRQYQNISLPNVLFTFLPSFFGIFVVGAVVFGLFKIGIAFTKDKAVLVGNRKYEDDEQERLNREIQHVMGSYNGDYYTEPYIVLDSFSQLKFISTEVPVILFTVKAEEGMGEKNILEILKEKILPTIVPLALKLGAIVCWSNIGGIFPNDLGSHLKKNNLRNDGVFFVKCGNIIAHNKVNYHDSEYDLIHAAQQVLPKVFEDEGK